ncbi:MAG: deoxyribodipyrimidine photo-lyase [Ilumatobacteraceae bacterium]
MSRAIFWFRRDLSLVDNLAWSMATTDHHEILPVYVLDHRLLDAAGAYRRRQLIASVESLARRISDLGGALTILIGDPVDAIARLAVENRVDVCVWNADVTGFAQRRDRAVEAALAHLHVGVETAWSTLVQPPGSITTASGAVPRVFGRFFEKWADRDISHRVFPGDAQVLSVRRDELCALDGDVPQAPGEDAGRARLDAFLERVDHYDIDRDRPDYDVTSHLSADLRFGVISPREVVRSVGRATPGRRAFVRQLAWRDWYAHLFAARPELVDHCQQPAFETIHWENDPDDLAAWREGRTGYPIVDAAMRELGATGWMHNRLRLITASFLIKDLLVDWRLGERHFRHLLIDGDVPQNAGNWQWSAGTGPDAAPYFRILNPVTQARRFDPEGDYVRRWVPELAAIPGAAIHAPWQLGPLELAGAGVVLAATYPAPIVDHATARQRALAAYAAARATS